MSTQEQIEELMNTIEAMKKANYAKQTAKPKKRQKKIATFEDMVLMTILTWCVCNILYNDDDDE